MHALAITTDDAIRLMQGSSRDALFRFSACSHFLVLKCVRVYTSRYSLPHGHVYPPCSKPTSWKTHAHELAGHAVSWDSTVGLTR